MSHDTTAPSALRGWLDALAVVLAGVASMVVVAALGLWLAGASQLPGSAFVPVVAATVVMAVGGRTELSGGAGFIASSDAGITLVPLSVSLAGALVTAAVFVRPLSFRAVTSGAELVGRFARTAVLWLIALVLITPAARHTFTISVGNSLLDQLGSLFGATPSVGFRATYPATIGFGLLWLLVVLALAVTVSRRAPLPTRLLHLEPSFRPAARVTVTVLLAYTAIGLIAAIVVAASGAGGADAGDVFAVVFLGLPNLAWLAFGLGLGATWDGSVKGGIGLPMPEALASVLRTTGKGDVPLNLSSLSQYDGRVWLLPLLAGVALLAAGLVKARRSPPGVGHLRNALHLALAMAVAMLAVGLLTSVHAHYGLSLFGIGDVSASGGLGGAVSLHCRLLTAVPIAAGWGAVAGFIGSVLASWTPKNR
ncbi:streptophobe family protein [Actinacidiphila soli]|uniref:streptophobe family protein n=1 Tax=Actinacidiphila soli TaxID=2487275 RepID=UPI000FC9BE2E|nr:streptophobe family protein [Actinacidiphila soli]